MFTRGRGLPGASLRWDDSWVAILSPCPGQIIHVLRNNKLKADMVVHAYDSGTWEMEEASLGIGGLNEKGSHMLECLVASWWIV